VFVEMPDKIGHRWYLWVFVAHDSTVFMMRKDRSTQAIRDHLGLDVSGIISSDRAKMYIAYAGENPRVVIAFCWVHVRRDFLKIAVEYPLLKSWADAWADRISQLFHLNHERDKHPDGEVQLREGMARFERDWRSELSCAQAHTPQKKVLSSLAVHWDGLTVFLDHPEIPMDNNTAESALRWEVIARKSIYGCRSLISAALLAAMASITTTLEQNGVSIREWLLTYLTACAKNKGKPPADISPWLPWTTKTAAVHLVA
jgi:transposase